jgi:hypothetical protein
MNRLIALALFAVFECASIPVAHAACGNWYALWIDCLVQKGGQRVIPQEYQNPGGQPVSNPAPSGDTKAVDRAKEKMLESLDQGSPSKPSAVSGFFNNAVQTAKGLFSSKANNKTSTQSAADTFGSQPSGRKGAGENSDGGQPSGTTQSQQKTYVPCGDGSSDVCFRGANGKTIHENAGSTFPAPQRANTLDDLLKERRDGQSANVVPQPNATPRPNSVSQTTPTPPQPKAATPSAGVSSTSPNAPSKTATLSVPDQARLTGAAAVSQPTPRVGGISFSKAAAERMPLNIALDATSFNGNRIILSGHDENGGLDAALFLTAVRAACEERDPYFSLDPDNGELWSKQGHEAAKNFWSRIKKNFPGGMPSSASKKEGSGIDINTVSAARDYAPLWGEMVSNYPNFRSKLVFYPEWLRQTRFGEILYKADVLLKELASGVSVLTPGRLRAESIGGYLSSDKEYVAKVLLSGKGAEIDQQPQWRGSRLWFDIAPSPAADAKAGVKLPPLASPEDPKLQSVLKAHGFARPHDAVIQKASAIVKQGEVFDLSQVNPKMFVRVHDHSSNRDLSDNDPRLDGLATDVTARYEQYAEVYEELRILRELFRAYIAAVHLADKNEVLCQQVDGLPLLESERVAVALPEYHRSELFLTVGNRWSVSRTARDSQILQSSSMSGGVSIGGRQFVEVATRSGQTAITQAVSDTIASNGFNEASKADPGRRYILLNFNEAASSAVKSNASLVQPRLVAGSSKAIVQPSDYEIENEPSAAELPLNPRPNNAVIWAILLTLLAAAFVVIYRPPARGGRR